MMTLQTDYLFYYFMECKFLYIISFSKLKDWFDANMASSRMLRDFQEKPQTKYAQMNDTWGICTPIPIIEREVGFFACCLKNTGETIFNSWLGYSYADKPEIQPR